MTNNQIEFKDMPYALTAKHIAQILNIGEANAYRLMHSDGFPTVKVGRKLLVPKLAFLRWMEDPKLFGGRKFGEAG